MEPLEPRHGDDWVPTVSVLFIISSGADEASNPMSFRAKGTKSPKSRNLVLPIDTERSDRTFRLHRKPPSSLPISPCHRKRDQKISLRQMPYICNTFLQ